jgi:hypothetical protein
VSLNARRIQRAPLSLDKDELDMLHRQLRYLAMRRRCKSDKKNKKDTALFYRGLTEDPLLLSALWGIKYEPPVGRVDDVYGDRNIMCSWPTMEAFAKEAS